MTSRRLLFRSDRHVEIEEIEIPEPGPEQVLVGVRRSQVSAGTEGNFFRQNPIDGPLVKSPLGYMTVGQIERIGSKVTEFVVGDRVVCCGHHGGYWLVSVGTPGGGSGQSTYIDRLDKRISADEAGFVVLGDVALHGIRRAGVQIDESVVVLGCGIVGQLTIQLARIAGAYPIVAVDLVPARLKQAIVSGATHVVDASRDDPVQAVREITSGRGGETIVHCAPVAGILRQALEMAAERGKIVLTASAPGTAEIGLQVELLRRELTILGNYEQGLERPHAYWPWTRFRNRQACLRLLATGQLRLDLFDQPCRPLHRGGGHGPHDDGGRRGMDGDCLQVGLNLQNDRASRVL